MYCRKCGSPNEEGAKFCVKCGAQMSSGSGGQKKRHKKGIWIGGGILIAVSVILATYFAMKNVDAKEEYGEYMTSARKYLEMMDYDKAEEEYLKAIAIDPKQEKPYLELAALYEESGDTQKAKDIIKRAQEKVPKKNQEELPDRSEEIKKSEAVKKPEQYVCTWMVEPDIEAEEIYYLAERDYFTYPLNELSRQFISPYAHAVVDDEENDEKISSRIAFGGQLLEETEPVDSFEGGVPWDMFYECDGELKSLLEDSGEGYEMVRMDIPEGVFPVQSFQEPYKEESDYGEWKRSGGKYAVYKQDEAITDFIYEECGSVSDGLLAVKKDGKWGYIDEDGREIIPVEYDASWQHYIPVDEQEDGERSYCYGASEGYVVLCKEDEWEMRDTTGEIVIPGGNFEELLPVYEGKCWAKKDGRWGVLKVYDWEEQDRPNTYEEGPVELTGVLESITWQHPNGEMLEGYILKLDEPVHFYISSEGEEIYKDCEDIQIVGADGEIDSSMEGRHVTVKGTLHPDAGTAYYCREYVIYDAVVSEVQ